MDAVTLEVTRIVAGGDGMARDADGRVTFVEGALPGETVRADLREQRRDFAKATTTEVLVPSSHRSTPPCPFVAAGCGGCDWQHITPASQRSLKAEIVADALRRQARIEVPVELGPELPATGYRTTIRGVVTDGRFGLRHRRSHDAVPVGPCLVAHPLLDELITGGRFPDGEVILRAGAATGERLAIVAGGPDGAEALVAAVTAAVDGALQPGSHLVDLYGGVGLFAGGVLAGAGGAVPAGRVTLVESGASSVADARVNLADLDARILKGDVATWRPARADAVIADPPRSGLTKTGVTAVAGTHAPRVVLVSCDPAALGRDTALLAAAGYELRSATLVDLFPHTSHVEVVSRFERT